MKKRKSYGIRFPASTIRKVHEELSRVPDGFGLYLQAEGLTISRGAEEWEFDEFDEFIAEYRRDPALDSAHLDLTYSPLRQDPYEWGDLVGWTMLCRRSSTDMSITASTRAAVEQVFELFEDIEGSLAPLAEGAGPPSPIDAPAIFIGHGGSPDWRDLKDHLQDKHEFKVVAYEIGARAGHQIRDILEEMMEESSLALLVMTRTDRMEDGAERARQNVVHEIGLFQGRLGFNRAIAVVEEGVQPFSNMDGVQQIRFGTGRIQEVFGDVVATIRREFAG